MRSQTKARAVVAAGLAVLAFAGGCGTSGGGGTTDAGVADPNATPDTRQASGRGTLTYAMTAGISQLDPQTLSSTQQLVLGPLLFNGLTKLDADGEVQPDLAESWRSSADAKSWTFTLHDGVRFHDGEPFDATAAKANIERVLDPKVPSQARTYIDMIDRIETPDPTTLVLRLKRPNALMPEAFTHFNLKMLAPKTFKNAAKTGVGTGPFTLEDFVPDDRLTLARNDGYWGEQGQVDTIDIVRSADTTAAITAFRAGDADLLWGVPPTDARSVADGAGGQLLAPKSISSVAAWEVDNTAPPFDDVRARQALAYAIDRDAMLTAAYGGLGTVPTASSLIDPSSPAYAKELSPYPFDLDKAKQLFDAAGVTKGTTLTFWATAGQFPEWARMGQILQQDLAKIGIDLKVQRSEFSTWLGKFYPPPKRFPATIVANFLSLPTIPAHALNFLRSGVCECNARMPGYDETLDEVFRTTDAAARGALYVRLQEIQNRAVPLQPVAFTAVQTVAQPAVTGAWVDSQGNVDLSQAGLAR